ncbi:MAG: dienelactone hydrolase family protein [Candidatus Dormibacterales bacterium]
MSTKTRNETVTADDGGRFDALLTLPEAGSGAGLLLIQEIFGLNDYIRQRSVTLSELGYVVLAPDVYWRLTPGVALRHDEAGLAEGLEYRRRLDYDLAVADCSAAFRHLRGLPEVTGATGVMGFCLGGGLAFHVAAAEHPDAAVCYYGAEIPPALHLADRVSCPVIFHFGADDPYIPPAARGAVETAFGSRPDAEVHVYPEARHAFDNYLAPMFHVPEAAAAAWPRTVEFLRRSLGAY